MEIFFLAAWALVPVMLSLLLAARLFGRDAVVKWCRDTSWQINRILADFGHRVVMAIRAFFAVAVDEGDVMDELEDRLVERLSSRLTLLDNKIYDTAERVARVEKHAAAVLHEGLE